MDALSRSKGPERQPLLMFVNPLPKTSKHSTRGFDMPGF